MDRLPLTGRPVIQDKTLPLITFFVLTMHVLAWAWIAYFNQAAPKSVQRSERKHLSVQTISLKPIQRAPSSTLIAANTLPAPASIAPIEAIPLPQKIPPTPPSSTLLPHKNDKTSPAISPAATVSSKPKAAPAPNSAKKTTPSKPSLQKNSPAKTLSPKLTPVKQAESKNTSKPESKITTEQAAKEAALKKQAEEQAAHARVAKERQHALLAQAQERIAKIAPARDKLAANQTSVSMEMNLPVPISSLKVDDASESGVSELGERETRYREELASRMKLLLRLPEYGEVKMKLTLDRAGKVVKLIITSTQSAKNRTYIEKTVPTLTFPSFASHFENEAQHTFSITLSNDL